MNIDKMVINSLTASTLLEGLRDEPRYAPTHGGWTFRCRDTKRNRALLLLGGVKTRLSNGELLGEMEW